MNEQNLSNYIVSRQPRHLALSDHLHGFVALNRSPSAIEGAESLARVDAPLDRSMVLFDDVVQVGASTASAATTEFPFPLQFRDYPRVGRVAVHVDHARPGMASLGFCKAR